MALTPYILAGSLLLAAATGVQGYRMGVQSSEARHVLEMSKASEHANRMERERLATQKEVDLLSQALEDQAYAEPAQSAVCLPAARVLRLNKR